MSTCTARQVTSGGVTLAARDHGGDGPPLVLTHGAGMSQGSLEPLVERLLPSYRVVTFDLRGYGRSGRGPWTLETAVQDVEAVVAAFGLDNPAVAGHSLGGLVAAAYGARHPSCPGVVNIDGHGLGRVEQYVGMDAADVRAWWASQQRLTARVGLLAALLKPLAVVLRKPLPSRKVTREVEALVNETDWFALYRDVRCPLLVFNATAEEDRKPMVRVLGEEGMRMLRAYRAGLRRDLDALAAERGNVECVEVEATHMLFTTHADEVAQHITRFLTRPAHPAADGR